jgi:8-oxo-dGTP diphosphatase
VVAGRRVLVGRRARPPFQGYAEFPGGKVHRGEEPAAAAAREVDEECGISVRVERLLTRVRTDAPHAGLDLFFFLCRPVGAYSRQPGSTFRWVPVEELDRFRFPPANAKALRALAVLLPPA